MSDSVCNCPDGSTGETNRNTFPEPPTSLNIYAVERENACLPRSQLASLIAIPMVMAKDEGDQ